MKNAVQIDVLEFVVMMKERKSGGFGKSISRTANGTRISCVSHSIFIQKLLAVPQRRLFTKTKYQQNVCTSTVKQMRIMSEL